MNAQLLNPFTIDIPDSVSTTLSTAECSVLLFNHGPSTLSGQYLAVGRSDGYITIWDIETKSVLRLLAGHVRPVTGLAWSTYHRYLASCSGDWNVIIWDLGVKPSIGGGPSTIRRASGRAGGKPVEEQGDGGEEARDSAMLDESHGAAGLPYTSERKRTIRFDCPVTSVQFAPGNSKRLVVVLASNEAYLVDIEDKIRITATAWNTSQSSATRAATTAPFTVEDVPSSSKRIPLLTTTSTATSSAANDHQENETTTAAPATNIGITAARFTPDSRHILAGTTKGTLLTFDANTGQLLDSSKVLATSSAVKELKFDSNGRYAVVNCNDRAIRILSISYHLAYPSFSTNHPVTSDLNSNKQQQPGSQAIPELSLLHKVQDMIQRTPWTNLGFSPTSEYIFAGASHKASHNVYIWDRTSGTLQKVLEGPKDWVIGVDWHPNRPMLASVSNTGAIYLWFTPSEEIWSAYAPGFEELEENIEYQEREDEFDFLHDGENVGKRKQQEEEAAFVRVTPDHHLHLDAANLGGGMKRRSQVSAQHILNKFGLNQTPEVAAQNDGKLERALESLCQRLDQLCTDSGWIQSESEHAQTNQHEMTVAVAAAAAKRRELVFTLLDDDDRETFVIPPRLEMDYSDFHDDHL